MRAEGWDGSEGLEGSGGVGGGGAGGFEDEVAAYAAEVRAQLADLPADDSAELLEDLEDHLREVAAEDAGTLRERLGEPATYARELRQAAGLPAPGEVPGRAASGPPFWRSMSRSLRRSGRDAAREAERRIRATRAGREVLDFLPSLRPAWWVLRAWVVVRLLEVWTGDVSAWHDYSTVPRIGDNRLLGFVALAAAVPASVYLGRRGVPAGWRRRAVLAAEGVLGVVAFVALVTGIAGDDGNPGGNANPYPGGNANPYQIGYVQQNDMSAGLHDSGRPVANLWVYDKDGKRLDGVYIYDQDGQPVSATPPGNSYGGDIDSGAWVDGDGQLITNRYPRQVLRAQPGVDNSMHYIPVPPPAVNPPKGVHQASDPQSAPSTASTSSTPVAPSTPQGSATPADPAPSGTPATPKVSASSP